MSRSTSLHGDITAGPIIAGAILRAGLGTSDRDEAEVTFFVPIRTLKLLTQVVGNIAVTVALAGLISGLQMRIVELTPGSVSGDGDGHVAPSNVKRLIVRVVVVGTAEEAQRPFD